MAKYADLEINLSPREADRYSVELRFSQPDDQAEPKREPGEARFQFGELHQQVLKPEVYGRILKESLFADQNLQTFFKEALVVTQHSGWRLRLRLWITAPKLHNLRWETLRTLEDDDYLVMDENTLFSRYLDSDDWGQVQLCTKGELRALVVVANPKSLADGVALMDGRTLKPVNVAGELKRARDGLKGIKEIDELASDPAHPGRVTLGNLVAKLGERRDILYLVCHGALPSEDDRDPHSPREPYLWLEKPDGKASELPGKELVQCIKNLDAELRPRLVVLASCQSAGLGQVPGPARSADKGALAALGPRLAQAGIPAVLAMQGDVLMDTVAEFMPVFFEQLTDHGQLERAMAAARGVVRDRPDWWMPVLFTRLKKGQLFVQPEGDAAPYIPKPYEPETISIPAGPFIMGSQGEDVPEEAPQHEPELSAYRIGKYPVTNEEYAEFIKREKGQEAPGKKFGWSLRKPPDGKLDHPAVGISWYDALAYCRWLSKKTGRRYRLPTEAEWERAARGTDGQIYPWGNDWEVGCCSESSDNTTPVTDHPEGASPDGCYDMVGNAQEWTSTLWGSELEKNVFPYPYNQDDGREDLEADKYFHRIYRIHRGGSYRDDRARLRCSARSCSSPNSKLHWRGFRVVLEV